MKVSEIKARLYARLLAASAIVMGQTGTGTVMAAPKLANVCPTINVLPRSEFEYPIGRKNESTLASREITLVPDPDAAEPQVEVVRKKDNFSLGKFALSVANEMIAKAKAQKKASLMVMA